jgi:DNA-binding NarL/FixJ family response regulator
MAATQKIRVLCTDDNLDSCRIVSHVISEQPDLQTVGTLNRADQLMEQVGKLSPDVVILDLSMPGKDPVEAMIESRVRFPLTRFLVLSAYDLPTHRSRALQHGASAYLIKDGNIDNLHLAIRRTAAKVS